MHPATPILAIVLIGGGLAAADTPAPAFTSEIQGDWHLLQVHGNYDNLVLDTPSMHGSVVKIAADKLTWPDPQSADKPWLVAACTRAPADPAAKGKPDPNELVSVVEGSLVPSPGATTASRWRVTDYGVLLVLVQRAVYTGNRNGPYSGEVKADLLFSLRREKVPPFQAPDPAKDRQALIGTWSVLTELDDANSSRTRTGGHVVITAERFTKLGGGANAKPIQGSGAYSVVEPAGPWGRIDLIEDREGRSPSLYGFCGPDLLYFVFPEDQGDRVAPEARQPPQRFRSDMNRNLWILQRRPAP